MNKFVIIISALITMPSVLAMKKPVKKSSVQEPLVKNCPFKLSDKEKKEIIENRAYFLKTLNEHVKINGGSQQKWFDLRCANLPKTHLETRFLRFINFSGANLDGSDANNARFEQVNFSNTSVQRVNANSAEFWDVIFDNANLSHTDFSSGQILGATKPVSARNANFSNINGAAVAMFKNIDFSGSKFNGAHFDTSGLEDIKIDRKTSFKNTAFTSAILKRWQGAPESNKRISGSRSRNDSNIKSFLLEQKANLTNVTVDGLDTDIPFH